MLLIPEFMRAELTFAPDSPLTLALSMQSACIPVNGSNTVQTSVVIVRDRYPVAERHGVFLLITGNRRANIGSMGKCMEAGYRLLSGFTMPSRHTSAMSGNAKKDNIFVCELSWELYTLRAIEEDLKLRRGSQPRNIFRRHWSRKTWMDEKSICPYELFKKVWENRRKHIRNIPVFFYVSLFVNVFHAINTYETLSYFTLRNLMCLRWAITWSLCTMIKTLNCNITFTLILLVYIRNTFDYHPSTLFYYNHPIIRLTSRNVFLSGTLK